MVELNRIPTEIVRNYIIPYTYSPQPANLCTDIRSYYGTVSSLKLFYSTKFPTLPTTDPDESDMAWLSNDIVRFLNRDRPTMFGIANYYKEVFRRIYLNHNKDLSSVTIPPIIGYDNFVDIKISIGLLLPSERHQLEDFLVSGIAPVSWSPTLGDMWPLPAH
jgi:hypothetical protein